MSNTYFSEKDYDEENEYSDEENEYDEDIEIEKNLNKIIKNTIYNIVKFTKRGMTTWI